MYVDGKYKYADGIQALWKRFSPIYVFDLSTHACEEKHPLLLGPTFEGPLEYIRIMFSAPCLTLSSMSFCLFRAARRLLLVHILASLLGVSGVKGQSEERNKYMLSNGTQ